MADPPAGYDIVDAPSDAPAGYEIVPPPPDAPALKTASNPIADPMTGSVSSMSAHEPSMWERVKAQYPIIDRAETGLSQAGASLGLTSPSNAQAVAKPLPGMDTQQAWAPERSMTSAERTAHPIATGAAEFAGGMTTPENAVLTGLTAGPAPQAIGRALGGVFSAQVLKGAYENYAPLKAAADAKDWGEVERLGTHMVLGATLGLLGVRRTIRGESPYEELSQTGREFSKVQSAHRSVEGIERNGVGLHNKVRDDLIAHQTNLRQQASAAMQPLLDKDAAQAPAISTSPALAEVAKSTADTGYTLKPAEQKLLQKLQGESPADQYAQTRGYKTSAAARADIESQAPGHGIWDQELQKQGLTDDPVTHLSLKDALALRTEAGQIAFGRNTAPKAKAAFTGLYSQLGDGIGTHVDTLDPAGKQRFDFYNNRHKMAFGLNDGVAGHMLDSLNNQDASASIPKLDKFATGNIKEIQQQMRKTGSPDLANRLDQSHKDALALASAHDAVSGKLNAGVYRMLQAHPKQAWPGLAVMGAAHGIGLPFPLPQIAGAWTAARNVGRLAKNEAGEVGGRLESELPPESFQTRTTPMSGDFPAPPQEGPSQPPGASPASGGPAGPSSPPQGNTAANAAHSGGFYDQVKAEHPDWTMSQQMMEAAKRETVGKPDLGKPAVNKPAAEDSNLTRERGVDNVDPAAEKVERLRQIRENQQAKIDNARSTGERMQAVTRRSTFEEQQSGGKRTKERKAGDIEKIKTRKG